MEGVCVRTLWIMMIKLKDSKLSLWKTNCLYGFVENERQIVYHVRYNADIILITDFDLVWNSGRIYLGLFNKQTTLFKKKNTVRICLV